MYAHKDSMADMHNSVEKSKEDGMKIYLSENRALLFLLCSSFAYTVISISELPWRIYILSLMFCVLMLSLYLLMNLDIVLLKKYRLVNVLVLLYSSSVLLSVYLNEMMSIHMLLVFFLQISIFPFIEIQREKGHFLFFCKVMVLWLVILIIINDLLMIVLPGRFFGDGISKTFFLGNKFEASYSHIMLLLMICILYAENQRVRRLFPLLFALLCLICRYMDCNTAVMGTIVFFLVSYVPNHQKVFLSRKGTITVVIILCAMFIYFSNLARIPLIKAFITDVLGRDVTLTGRHQIYQILPRLFKKSPWIGYGNSSEAIYKYTGAYNAQNGFFDLIIRNGLPSALSYAIMVVALIQKPKTKGAGYILGAIYCYLIMSLVEITFGNTLLLYGILLFTDSCGSKEKTVTIIEWNGGHG